MIIKKCNCEHWQQCPVCMPHRFDAEGNRLPPEPTPLQACQVQVSALKNALFQSQEAAKNLAKREWVGLSESELAGMTLAQQLAMRYAERFLKEKNT